MAHTVVIKNTQSGTNIPRESFGDVKLVVGDKVFVSHRFMLARACAHFNNLFLDTATDDSIEVCDTQADAFDQFLNFIYGYEITVAIVGKREGGVEILSLFELADRYHVTELIDKLEDLMMKNIGLETAAPWCDFARDHSRIGLMTKCFEWVEKNFQALLTDHEATVRKSFSVELWKSLIESDNLIVQNEKLLFDAIRWLANKDVQARLFPLLRYYFMDVIDLEVVRRSNLVDQNLVNRINSDKTLPSCLLPLDRQPPLPRQYTERFREVVVFQLTEADVANGKQPSWRKGNQISVLFQPNGDSRPDVGLGKVGVYISIKTPPSRPASEFAAKIVLVEQTKFSNVVFNMEWGSEFSFKTGLGTEELLSLKRLMKPEAGFLVKGEVIVICSVYEKRALVA